MADDTLDLGESGSAPTVRDLSRILVPFDGSAQSRSALPYAAAIAGQDGTITMLTVVPPGASAEAMPGAKSRLETASVELRAAGYHVESRVLSGDPAEHIIEAAANGGAGLIVIGSHGRGAVGRLIHGSVADQVAREATVPVMVIRSEIAGPGPVGILRLVLPLDGSPLAEQSLPVAMGISRRLGTPLLLVRAVNLAEIMPPAVGMGEAIPFELYDQTEEEMEKEATSYLDRIAASLREQGFSVVTQVVNGPATAAISEATKLGDVVVICSHERSGPMRWLLGSVAERLVRTDDAPVILVPAIGLAARQ
jgi:nucleotide-binding universal stress UspA family protein